MSTYRRDFLRLSVGAPFLAGTPAAAQGQGVESRSALVEQISGGGAEPGALYFDGRLFYAGRMLGEAEADIPDLPGLVPRGEVSAMHFGVVPDLRDEARRNVVRMRAAVEWARATGEPLHLPAGSVFLADRIDVTGIVLVGRGISAVEHLPRGMQGRDLMPARSQLVMTGEAVTAVRVHGISSMKECGARRRLAVPRADLDEAEWRMVSLMNNDATDGAATPVDLAVGLLIENGDGTALRGFRVLADGGGRDGLDAYNDPDASRIVGNIDIGILQLGGRGTMIEDVQCTGHFRRYGYLVAAVDRDGDFNDYSAPYETHVIRCNFQGLRAFGIRGPDKFAILDHTAESVDLPWADDHPFTLDQDHDVFRLSSIGTGTAGGATFRYARIEKVTVDGEPRLRLGGLEEFDPGEWEAVVAARAGGANSHIVLRDCQIGGLIIPSGHSANDVANVEDAVSNGAIGGFEISGWRAAEADIQGRIQHNGSLMGFLHEARETVLDVMCEANGSRGHRAGATWIVSPQHNENTHAVHPVGGPRWVDWRYAMVTERSASNTDFAPFMDFIPRPELFQDTKGWFQGYWVLRAPQIRYRYDQNGSQNYLAVPALSVGEEAEGYSGPSPEAPIEIGTRPVADETGALRFLPVETAALADATHPINTHGKSAGKAVFEAEKGRLLLASGSPPNATWLTAEGDVGVQPR